jgi:predicted NAD/FAD-dependent oxidoreductase
MLPHMVSVAVIGSGISGLMCAQTILRQSPGVTVAVYEWGRGPGGRTARRRIAINETCSASFDHAAPFFAASTSAFSDSVLKEWIDRGIAARWNGHSASFVREGEPTPASRAHDHARFTGVPTMHSICCALSEEVVSAGGEMLFGRHVLSANFAGDGEGRWRVVANNRFAETGLQREERNFDAIVLSDKLLVLPNQYAVLSKSDVGALALPQLASEARVVLLVAFKHTEVEDSCRWDVLELQDAGTGRSSEQCAVRLIVHESTKPQRAASNEGGLDLWVVHSGAEYAARHLRPEEDGVVPGLLDEKSVKEEMLAEFLRVLRNSMSASAATGPASETDLKVAHSSVMVWDHAQPRAADRLPGTHLVDAPRRAGVCGDFFGKGAWKKEGERKGEGEASGVEAAALSGVACGSALAPTLRDLMDQRAATKN